MPKAHFTSQELAKVLSHYDIGIIEKVSPLAAGNARAPKLILKTGTGTFLLKRRPHGKDDPRRVALAHDVQRFLAEQNFPLARLKSTRDELCTLLLLEKHVYEIFEYVAGTRYDGSPAATADAGHLLAAFHKALADFKPHWLPAMPAYHDSIHVRGHFDSIASEKRLPKTARLKALVNDFRSLYDAASDAVNKLGFKSWPRSIVHGDWHPGNMLFNDSKIVAVLDFDSLKSSPIITDLANALLQFSLVGGRPNPVDWPDYLDQSRFERFLEAYGKAIMPSEKECWAISDLMIEALIAEAVMPIAVTGTFGNLSGVDFLEMVLRKCRWIEKNRELLMKQAMI
jgi:Ser/Thr protein kinase RdoA (MazF antagonist)